MLTYILIINLIEFILMGIDKYLAIKKLYRIPEFTLLFMSAIGGSIGGILGMITFRHKTKKIKFIILIPLFLIINTIIILNIKK